MLCKKCSTDATARERDKMVAVNSCSFCGSPDVIEEEDRNPIAGELSKIAEYLRQIEYNTRR